MTDQDSSEIPDFRALVEQALFMRQYGERPPGAPKNDPNAETWRDWDIRAEAALRDALPT